MYQLFFNGYPLYDPRDKELIIRDPDTHLAVGEAGEMSFTIDSDHPYGDKVTRLKGTLELLADGVRIYKGRVIKDTRQFDLSREIKTEGLMACLNDSIIPPFNFPDDFLDDEDYQAAAADGNVVEFFLSWLLNQHNSQVGDNQKIKLGNVTVTDSNNYISRPSSDYLTTMEVVRTRLEDLLGGYLLADYSGDITALHYYEELPLTNTQVVEYGENLLDLLDELDSTDTYTAILPVGADGLTIEELDDGEISSGIIKEGKIIYSQEAEEDCGGRITKVVSWDNVTLATNLRTKAVAKLTGEGVMTSQTVEVTAADLGGSADVSRFVVGRNVCLQSTPHGLSATFPLMELEPDIFDPGNTKITMGITILAASDISHASQSSMKQQLESQQIQLVKQAASVATLSQSVTVQITEAIQDSEGVFLKALESYVETGNFEEYRKTVSSQLSLLSDEMTLKFKNVTEHIQSVNGDVQKQLETITKYFTFDIDGLTIGQAENTNKVVIDNDEISIMVGGVVVQRFDAEGRALIPELSITRLVDLLGYQIEEDDSGNLNCDYIGG